MKSPKPKEIIEPLEAALLICFNTMQLGEPSKQLQKIIKGSARKLSTELSHQLKKEFKKSAKEQRRRKKKEEKNAAKKQSK